MSEVKVRVDYDPTPIRHIAVQCPYCGKWFDGREIIAGNWDVSYEYHLHHVSFECPLCGQYFGTEEGDEIDVEEVSYPDVYKGVLRKKVTVTYE